MERKFPLLEEIRQVVSPTGVAATISLGVGKDAATFEEAFSFAALSIEMALSRGGDQAVIKDRYNFSFFGGRTKETDHRSKVRARVTANSLLELVAAESMIDSVVSAGSVTAELILQYVRAMQNATGSQIKTLHRIVDETVEALEFGVTNPAAYIGVPLKNLKLRENVLLVSITHGSSTEIPGGDSFFKEGDTVVVVTSGRGVLRQFNDIFA